MIKKKYIEPKALMIVLDEEGELLINTITDKGTTPEDSWAKEATTFDTGEEGTEENAESSWFDDSKSSW